MKWLAALALASVVVAQPQTPLDVALLVDVSHSVTHSGFVKTDRALVAEAASAMASTLDASARLRVGTFGPAISISPVLSRDPAAVLSAISALGAIGGPSPVWDALAAAANAWGPVAHPRAIVLITDGRSTGNTIGFAEIVARLETERIPVLVIALDLTTQPGPDPAERLRVLAERTGGSYMFVKRNGVAAAIKAACRQLHMRLKSPAE